MSKSTEAPKTLHELLFETKRAQFPNSDLARLQKAGERPGTTSQWASKTTSSLRLSETAWNWRDSSDNDKKISEFYNLIQTIDGGENRVVPEVDKMAIQSTRFPRTEADVS